MLDGLREGLAERGLAIADPAEVAEAVELIERDGRTGQAWVVQAGRPAVPFGFPAVEPVLLGE
jgi:hypothetical protein